LSKGSWLHRLVSDDHGEPDIGRLAVLVLIGMVVGSVAAIIVMDAYALHTGRKFDPTPIGVAVGAICGGFSTALGALGLYLIGDKKPTPPQP
jgi:hypothetical protein